MKNKHFYFLFIILAIILLSIVLVKSQDNPAPNSSGIPDITGDVNPETGIPKTVEKVQKAGDIISDEDQRTTYLKQEWQKILEKSPTFGPIVKFILKLDPVSNLLLGMPIAFSWYFFLTLIIWITFVVFIYYATSLFEVSKWLHYIIAIALISVITYYRQPKSIATFTVGLITRLSKTWWMQYVIMGIVILVLILVIYFSKQLQIIGKWIKEKQEKNFEALEKEKTKVNNEAMDTFRKGLSK
jgi:Na+-transporting methylmalonyl-CoA/oxaloacetate decarboxylase gamma subunit